MASTKRQKIRFTGKRTGLEATRVPGFGVISKGETIEVDADVAERWAVDQPTRDGKMASDWTTVGSSFKQDEAKTQEKELKQRTKLHEDLDVPDVELAHGVDEDGATAEEDAEAAKEGASE